MKRIITMLIALCVCMSICPFTSVFANTDNADLKTLTINNGDFEFELAPNRTFYSLLNHTLTEMIISVEAENSNSTIIFGQITDNSGQFYENPLQEWEHTFTINQSAKGVRLLVKVISENGENEKVYSLVVKDLQLGFFIGTNTTFMNIDNIDFYMGASMPPLDESITNAIQGLVGEGERIEYRNFVPCDKDTYLPIEYDKDNVFEAFYRFVRPSPGGGVGAYGWGENYRIYYIENGIAEQIPTLWEDHMSVSFLTNKYGIIAIVYDPRIHTASFFDQWDYNISIEDWNEFYTIDNLAQDDVILAPPTNPTRSGYTFLGWYTYGIEGQPLTDETTASECLVFLAYWEKNPISSSNGSSASNTIINTPTANHKSGTVPLGTKLDLSTTYKDGKIYYTLDGTTPTINSSLYENSIIIDKSMTLKYIVVTNGKSSAIVSQTFTVESPKINWKENAEQIRYIEGYSDDTFKPDKAITRYEMLKSLSKLIDMKLSAETQALPDVSDDMKETVAWFMSAGIIDGYNDGTFKGDEGLSRAEFVKIMSLILNLEINPTTENKFRDITTHWAKDYINTFADLNYLQGYGDNEVKPDNKLTRAEFTVIINRIVKLDTDPISNIYVDISSEHWAFSDILMSYLSL